MKIGTDGESSAVDLGQQTDSSNPNKTFIINVSGDWIYYSNKNDNKTPSNSKIGIINDFSIFSIRSLL
jgi:hypothetical protein